jgi:hypothetical protein
MLSHRIGKFSLSAVAAALMVALPLAVATDAQASAQCYGYYTFKSDQYQSKSAALNAAIGGWSAYVASHYGKSYAYWSHAAYPSTGCSQYGYYWVCWAKAEPCYWAPPSYRPSYKPYHKPSYGGGSSGY